MQEDLQDNSNERNEKNSGGRPDKKFNPKYKKHGFQKNKKEFDPKRKDEFKKRRDENKDQSAKENSGEKRNSNLEKDDFLKDKKEKRDQNKFENRKKEFDKKKNFDRNKKDFKNKFDRKQNFKDRRKENSESENPDILNENVPQKNIGGIQEEKLTEKEIKFSQGNDPLKDDYEKNIIDEKDVFENLNKSGEIHAPEKESGEIPDQKQNTKIELQERRIMNLYTGVRGIAVKVLNRIDRTDAYLDKLLESELKNAELSGQDKALLYEIVHGVIRWGGRIDWILNGFHKGQFSKSIPNVKNALRVALYQILFLTKVPDYAAVNEAVEFIKKLQGQKPADFTNAVLRNIIRNKNAIRYPDPNEDLVGYLSSYYSHPAWMVKRWVARFGKENTEKLLEANNERPGISLRANTNKISVDEFRELLQKVDLKFHEGNFIPGFFKLKTITNITDWEYFAKGFFSIQDESTGLPCILLDPKPGMRVLDLCAAPGGKSAFMSNLMKNEGEIVALDRYESRIKILDKNLSRVDASNVKVTEGNAHDFTDDEKFDRVLLDAPCSGLGTLSKKPDIKWKRELPDVRELAKVQYELLKKAATLVKIGGSVVYSTCTIEPEENFEIVKRFLDENPNFKLHPASEFFSENLLDENKCVQTLPHIHKVDGAFCARIDRVS